MKHGLISARFLRTERSFTMLLLTDLATDVDTVVGAPDIVLEVNDRTINIYMRAFINTRSLQIPGNPRSDSATS